MHGARQLVTTALKGQRLKPPTRIPSKPSELHVTHLVAGGETQRFNSILFLLFWGTLCGTWYLTMGTEVKHLRVATQNSAWQMGTTELITSGWLQDSIYFWGCKTCELLYCIRQIWQTLLVLDQGPFFLFGWKTT